MDRTFTKSMVEAASNLPELEQMHDEVQSTIVKITTQLEHDYGDQNWAQRAIDALAHHRNAARWIKRRIEAVKGETLPEPAAPRRRVRLESENSPTTNAALPRRTQYSTSTSGLETIEACDAFAAKVRQAIDEVCQDRADEVSRPPSDRDHGFIAATTALIKAWNAQLQAVQTHSGTLRKELRLRQDQARGVVESARFVTRAREVLPQDVYLAIWEHVNTQPGVS